MKFGYQKYRLSKNLNGQANSGLNKIGKILILLINDMNRQKINIYKL